MGKLELTADRIIENISGSDALEKYDNYRAAILAGYFECISELYPEEMIKTGEVAKLLKWTFSKS